MSLNERLETFLLLEREEEKKRHGELKANEYYAGWAGMCPRKIYLMKKNNIEAGADVLKIFMVGNLVHEFVRTKLLQLGDEERITYNYDDISIRGRCDGVDHVNRKVYEFKTTNRLPKQYYEHHLGQLSMYMHYYGYDGVLVYIEKNTGEIKEFEINFRDSIFKKYVSNILTAHYCLVNNAVPDKSTESWECKYCFKECKEQCDRV